MAHKKKKLPYTVAITFTGMLNICAVKTIFNIVSFQDKVSYIQLLSKLSIPMLLQLKLFSFIYFAKQIVVY